MTDTWRELRDRARDLAPDETIKVTRDEWLEWCDQVMIDPEHPPYGFIIYGHDVVIT